MQFTFTRSRRNVHMLTAPYALLAEAFGDSGLTAPRDDFKQMAQWNVSTPAGEFEIYDYKVGKCYASDGLELKEITEWHVQGPHEALDHLVRILAEAGGEEA